MTPINEQSTQTPAQDPKIKTRHSKIFILIVAGLIELLLIIAVFSVGVKVGAHKARFTYSWANNYPQNFEGPAGQMRLLPPPGRFFNAHGLAGTILSKDSNGLIVKDQDGDEKTVVVSDDTTIRQNSENLKVDDLKVNQQILVLGEPNDNGQIEAKLIRVFSQ